MTGSARVLSAVRQAWASLYTPQAIYYRLAHDIDQLAVGNAVIIQSLVDAVTAGILTTRNVDTNARDQLTVEAVWGLGEAVSRGLITPDRYLIAKETGRIEGREQAVQTWQLGRGAGSRPAHLPVPPQRQAQPKLTEPALAKLAELAVRIESHFQFPQEIEWVASRDQLFIVDARPLAVTTQRVRVRGEAEPIRQSADEQTTPPLLVGTGSSLGVASGPVRIVRSPNDLERLTPGDILVAELASPDYLPAFAQIKALITDAGGRTSHTVMAAREAGIPAVVGTGRATHLLHEGQIVTVDGTTGRVYRGAMQNLEPRTQHVANRHRTGDAPHTATKVYAILADPAHAAEVAKLPVDGVGLLRAEFMIATFGQHPKAVLAAGQREQYVNALADHLEVIARAFHPHPVIYRASDFKSNEYRALRGGAQFEPNEENPMLGWRGTRRHIADPEPFRAELAALREVRARRGWDNVQLMLPFVRTIEEFQQAQRLIQEAGLLAERTFRLAMMCELPSNVFLIDQFLDAGVQGISIGTNDLTQLILGVDRDNERLSDVFDERNPAVLEAVRQVIRACAARHIPVGVCGDAPARSPEFAEFLVREGVTSISVGADRVWELRELVASVEHQLHREPQLSAPAEPLLLPAHTN